ncbi:hypothetical protein MRX96_044519 [Rhipicephalus microplus]
MSAAVASERRRIRPRAHLIRSTRTHTRSADHRDGGETNKPQSPGREKQQREQAHRTDPHPRPIICAQRPGCLIVASAALLFPRRRRCMPDLRGDRETVYARPDRPDFEK